MSRQGDSSYSGCHAMRISFSSEMFLRQSVDQHDVVGAIFPQKETCKRSCKIILDSFLENL